MRLKCCVHNITVLNCALKMWYVGYLMQYLQEIGLILDHVYTSIREILFSFAKKAEGSFGIYLIRQRSFTLLHYCK
jgi:hypothetical protein